MKCNDIELLLSAHIDDELSPQQSQAVQEHLQGCESCQEQLEELRVVDRKLSTLQPPAGLAQRIEAAVRQTQAESTPPSDRPVERTGKTLEEPVHRATPDKPIAGRPYAWAMIAAIAASVALIVFSDPANDSQQPAPQPLAGQIVRSTGDVELLTPGSQFWKLVSTTRAVPVPEGARVRTADTVMCEIETTRSGRIRVDEQAELILHARDRVEVVKGKVWCQASADQPLKIETAAGAIGATSQPWSMTCPSSSEFQVTVNDKEAVLQSMADQLAQWNIGSYSCPVGPGETVAIDPQHNIQRSSQPGAASKAWQLPLLAIDNQGQSELSSVLQPLLAPIGRTKAMHLHEQQIRSLGPPGAVPLLAYVLSDDSRQQPDLRRSAIRLATESCDAAALDLLRQLSSDEDPYVARQANEAILRLAP